MTYLASFDGLDRVPSCSEASGPFWPLAPSSERCRARLGVKEGFVGSRRRADGSIPARRCSSRSSSRPGMVCVTFKSTGIKFEVAADDERRGVRSPLPPRPRSGDADDPGIFHPVSLGSNPCDDNFIRGKGIRTKCWRSGASNRGALCER
jgi:hypothetical protein